MYCAERSLLLWLITNFIRYSMECSFLWKCKAEGYAKIWSIATHLGNLCRNSKTIGGRWGGGGGESIQFYKSLCPGFPRASKLPS